MSSQSTERVAALYLNNPNDPTRLSLKQVQEQWGSWTQFLECYNLRAFDYGDLEEGLQISRLLQEKWTGNMAAQRKTTSQE
jgi:hypothetical protein